MTGLLDTSLWENNYFDGRWQKAPRSIPVLEKATGEQLGVAGSGTAEVAVKLTEKAKAAQTEWALTPPDERAKTLREAARLIEENADEITGWIIKETGGIGPKAGFEISVCAGEFYHAAALLVQPCGEVLPSQNKDRMSIARRVPLGVVSVITPWNFPLVLATRSVAPALALGNAVVLKPDPQTPVTGGFVLARALEMAGLPEGVFSVIAGGADVGEALVTAPAVRLVTFTGSTAVGRRVGELAGKHLKKVALELGGNNPMIVLEDADVDTASSCGAWGSYLHQGQICMTTGRHIVVKDIAEDYVGKLAERAARLPVGNPAEEGIALGPIINAKQVEKIHGIVTDSINAGAKLVTGGSYEGLFYKPTVLDNVTPGMRAFDEEIFGPVAAVTVVENEAEAIRVANQSPYGLSAAVLTGSMERGQRVANQLKAGMVHINDQTVADHPGIPMGGMGASGTGSRFGSTTNWDEFTEWQWLTLAAAPAQYPF